MSTPKLKPTGLRSRILMWMVRNPGEHRPRDVAAGLGQEGESTAKWTTKVNTAMSRMHTGGILVRERRSESEHGPGVFYRIAADQRDSVGSDS